MKNTGFWSCFSGRSSHVWSHGLHRLPPLGSGSQRAVATWRCVCHLTWVVLPRVKRFGGLLHLNVVYSFVLEPEAAFVCPYLLTRSTGRSLTVCRSWATLWTSSSLWLLQLLTDASDSPMASGPVACWQHWNPSLPSKAGVWGQGRLLRRALSAPVENACVLCSSCEPWRSTWMAMNLAMAK